MTKFTVQLKHNRKEGVIEIKNILAGTIVTANDGHPRLKLFTADGKTHSYQAELYMMKVVRE